LRTYKKPLREDNMENIAKETEADGHSKKLKLLVYTTLYDPLPTVPCDSMRSALKHDAEMMPKRAHRELSVKHDRIIYKIKPCSK